jgi:hypothetical protein
LSVLTGTSLTAFAATGAAHGRKPTDYDLTALRRMHDRQGAIYQADPAAAKQLLSVGDSNRDESLDVAAHAALSSVCLAILNLDEALTRE